MVEEITGTESLIEKVCKKCIYYRKICWFDYGDSITKIPCNALKALYELYLEKEKKERPGLDWEQIF